MRAMSTPTIDRAVGRTSCDWEAPHAAMTSRISATTPLWVRVRAKSVISYLVDPIADSRWTHLIERDNRATLFHTPQWLVALRETYGYEPVVLTTSAPSEPLANGVVFCRVKSWLTGDRLVSLPFSDHCEPLIEPQQDLGEFVDFGDSSRWRYIELRPVNAAPSAKSGQIRFSEGEKFWLHRLDLSPSADELFRHFHADCVRRKIRKAEKEGVVHEVGNTTALLDGFYRLLLRTRRRHRLPPQPKAWFRNLAKFLGDRIQIRVASKDGRPIASIITLNYKNKLMYKYGCSDERYHRFGAVQLLLWRAIQDAKEKNYPEFDLGRCEWENSNLRIFKDRWGANRSKLTYWRYQPGRFSADHERQLARKFFRSCPPRLLQAAGRTLYRHIG
jgi:CelD/BcsL family acetyltransferase involved in cellulose biosynthesis